MPTPKKQSLKKASVKRTQTSVLDRISDIDINENLKMCIYGRGGTGKTTVAATFPKPMLYINIPTGLENGLRSIKGTPGIKAVNLLKTEELRDLIEHAKDSGKYKTLVIDHVTNLQEMVLTEILGLSEMPLQKSWGMASRQDYGTSSIRTKEWIRDAIGVDCHTILLAQERQFNPEEGEELFDPYVGPGLTPAVAEWFNASCDYLVHTFIRQKTKTKNVSIAGKKVEKVLKVKGVDYCMRLAPDPVYWTKFRVTKGTELPDIITDPSYDKLQSVIDGSEY